MSQNLRPSMGRASLVGTGPGDPELMTLKAVRALAEADVVLYDALVDPAILEHVRASRHVVRLKGATGSCSAASARS